MLGGNNWLEVLTCGQPVVTEGSSGLELAKNMKGGYDYIGLHFVQIESGVLDGVYFHCSFHLYIWDALHKAGLIYKHMKRQDSFKWLEVLVTCCS